MLKIYLTQLRGVLQKITENEEENFEDAARLLAQAAISDGSIYIYGFNEMSMVTAEALQGPNALIKAHALIPDDLHLSPMDRVILITRSDDDEEAAQLAKQIADTGAMTIGLSTMMHSEPQSFANAVDLHINLQSKRALIPGENGERLGHPATLAALFTYHCLLLTLHEVLEDQ
ncbi:hypothetical protein GCM10011391_03980 [Pullulanibacillus camelliae]|uniref:DUF2529 domain-containing protein n=1 Tax=Pullulanibacillus camelliae TaxID=1707096 RepID=A0A8J2VK19_9BACL|nr:DUF2529 family protein [Pullulanibacillus camelliae]GGE28608.1 hypothetical protein GCM10011391_03980 [Pullulanibacillus camelliae]